MAPRGIAWLALSSLIALAACSRRARPAPAVDLDAAVAVNEPALRPLDEPTLPPGACQRELCVAPSDTPVVPPFRAPFSRCAPVVSLAAEDRHPGDAPEGVFSPAATRTGRRLVADACCYTVPRACDAGTGTGPDAAGHRAVRR